MTLTKPTLGMISGHGVGKNAIINGAFDIWQRGTSFVAAVSGAYSADRWKNFNAGASVFTVNRSTDVPTVAQAGVLANYSMHIDVTTADTSVAASDIVAVGQIIEGLNWRKYAQRDLTLSFWVKSTKTGTFSVGLYNSGLDRAFVAEYTVNASNTWEKKVIRIPASPSAGTWNYQNGAGVGVFFTLMSGSNFHLTTGSWQTTSTSNHPKSSANQVNAFDSTSNDFFLTLVQLEVGNEATDFEIVDYGAEFARCQRYYQEIGTAGVSDVMYFASSMGATTYYTFARFPVVMRAAPTGTVAGSWTLFNVSALALSAAAGGVRIDISVTGGSGTAFYFQNSGANSRFTFNAEL